MKTAGVVLLFPSNQGAEGQGEIGLIEQDGQTILALKNTAKSKVRDEKVAHARNVGHRQVNVIEVHHSLRCLAAMACRRHAGSLAHRITQQAGHAPAQPSCRGSPLSGVQISPIGDGSGLPYRPSTFSTPPSIGYVPHASMRETALRPLRPASFLSKPTVPDVSRIGPKRPCRRAPATLHGV